MLARTGAEISTAFHSMKEVEPDYLFISGPVSIGCHRPDLLVLDYGSVQSRIPSQLFLVALLSLGWPSTYG